MNRRRDNVLLGWSTSCLAVALLAAVVCIAAGEPYREAARADASAHAPDAACEQWFGTAVVLVVCGGQTSGDFRVSGGEGRGFALLASLGNGLLRGDVISAGERVLISGRATRSSHLAVLIVDSSGRPSIASFDRLGLESGGRAVLEVRGRSGAPSFRLRKPGGAVVAPTRIGPFSDRRYVAGLRVERRGKRLNVTFVAPARLAEVREMDLKEQRNSGKRVSSKMCSSSRPSGPRRESASRSHCRRRMRPSSSCAAARQQRVRPAGCREDSLAALGAKARQ